MMIPVNEIKQREDISIMSFIRKNGAGILLCLAIAIPSWIIGQRFPVVGGAVIGNCVLEKQRTCGRRDPMDF